MTTKKKLIIVGGGALGREVLLYAQDMIIAQSAGLRFDGFAGFLDEAPGAAGQLRALGVDFESVEPIDEHQLRADCLYVLAVGNAKARRNILNRMDAKTTWTNIVHPTAYLASSATLAAGVIVAPFAFVGANARLGDHVVLNTYASVGHDSQVGACCVLSPYAVINGNVTLGEQTFMGTHATVIPGRKIGKGSSLSAGAVVVRDVEPGFFMMGNPARGWRMDGDDSH